MPVAVLLLPAGTVLEQKSGEFSIATKYRMVQRRRVPITASACDWPAKLNHQHHRRIAALGRQLRLRARNSRPKALAQPRLGGFCIAAPARCQPGPAASIATTTQGTMSLG